MVGNCHIDKYKTVTRVLLPVVLMAEKGAMDYTGPKRGMAAMRVRIIRSELHAGSHLSLYNAPEEGDEDVVEEGEDNQPRTTSTGAFFG